MRAGVGRADITPPVGIPAGGWGNQLPRDLGGERPRAVGDGPRRRGSPDGAAAPRSRTSTSASSTTRRRRGRGRSIAQAAGIPVERVAVGTTHNHSVPGHARARRCVDPPEPRARRALCRVGLRRRSGMRPPRPPRALRPVRVGSREWALAARREPADDDARRPGRRRAQPRRRRRTTPLTVVRLDGDDDRPVATIVHYACHPIILGPDNTFVTPEYPGIVKRVVEAALGGHCLFVQGACGDVGPSELFVPDLATYRRLGAMIGHEAAATAFRAGVARAPPAAARGRGVGLDRVVRVRARRRAGRHRRASRARCFRCRCATTSAIRRAWRPMPSAGRTRPTRLARPARRTARCESSPCARSSPACAPSAATRSTGLDAYPLLVHGIRLGPGRAARRPGRALLRDRHVDPGSLALCDRPSCPGTGTAIATTCRRTRSGRAGATRSTSRRSGPGRTRSSPPPRAGCWRRCAEAAGLLPHRAGDERLRASACAGVASPPERGSGYGHRFSGDAHSR